MFPLYHGKHYIKGYDRQFAVDFYILVTLLSLSNARSDWISNCVHTHTHSLSSGKGEAFAQRMEMKFAKLSHLFWLLLGQLHECIDCRSIVADTHKPRGTPTEDFGGAEKTERGTQIPTCVNIMEWGFSLRCDAEIPPPLTLSSICFRNSSALIWLISSQTRAALSFSIAGFEWGSC